MTTTEKMLSAENAVTNETFTYDDLIEFEGNDFGNAQRFLKFIDGRVYTIPCLQIGFYTALAGGSRTMTGRRECISLLMICTASCLRA